MEKNKFNPGARITIFFIFFAFLFFSLGLWQIERGQSKQHLLDEFENNTQNNPNVLNENSKKWDRVYVQGKWDSSKQVLIDNVINRGIAGFKVLTPLRILETDQLILIDRGWVKRNQSRENLPDVTITDSNERVSGILEYPELGLVLSGELVSDTWPKVSQTKNLEIISKEYNEAL